MTTFRIPNPNNPTEVRQAFQAIQVKLDTVERWVESPWMVLTVNPVSDYTFHFTANSLMDQVRLTTIPGISQNSVSGYGGIIEMAIPAGEYSVIVQCPAWNDITTILLNDEVLTGHLDLPVSELGSLTRLECYGNTLSGMPDWNECPKLTLLHLGENDFTWCPDLSGCTAMKTLYLHSNNITGITIGSLRTQLQMETVSFWNNALNVSGVNQVLMDLLVNQQARTDNIPLCNVNIAGGTNATPTGDGLAAKNALEAAGWTVTTN